MKLTKLGTVAEILTGFPFKGELYSSEGVRVVRGENVTEGKLRWDTIKCWNHPFDKFDFYSLKEDDVVIGMDGSKVGKNKARILKEHLPLLLAQRVACVRANAKSNQGFLFYCINNPRFVDYVFRIQTGSSVPHISKHQIEAYEIPIPEIQEQQKIAKVLSDLDAKIELNNKINAELEAMAKLIYDYWFVQFDFPTPSPSGRAGVGQPYKSSGGKMVYNEELKREIPEGWGVMELQHIANITMGQSPPGESYNENGEGTVFYQGCTDFGSRFPTVRQYTTQPSRFASEGDLLLSVRAPVGTMNIANQDCCIGRGLAALNSKHGSEAYLYEVMKYFKQIFDRRNSDGTTFGAITKTDLFSLKSVVPPDELITEFEKRVGPSYTQLSVLERQNQQLSSLRDWLLPMLMNGQVGVGGMDSNN